MRVLSLFDGISCGQVALNRIGIEPEIYFASEIDKHAIKVTQHNFPNTIQLGDIQKICEFVKAIGPIDLLLAGSPCQGFSQAGKMLGFDDPRSQLFFNAVSILGAVKPKNFLFENVRLKKSDAEIFKLLLGVNHVEINSALVSAQNRRRYYWTNIEFDEIKDLGIEANSVIDHSNNDSNSDTWFDWYSKKDEFLLKKQYCTILNDSHKGICQCARQVSNWQGNLVRNSNNFLRFASPLECERLQTLPDNYTSAIANSHRYKALGNCWTVDVVAHILKGLVR